MNIDEILQEIILRLAEIIIQGGSEPKKIVVSEEVYGLITSIKLLPSPMERKDGVYYIANIPVQKTEYGVLDAKGIWFKIV